MKNYKWIYRISTGLISLLMLMSAGMYFFNHAEVSQTFTNLGYPTYIIYPLAVAKVLGLIAIWTDRSKSLKEWAYAGFFFDFVLAFSAHLAIGDGQFAPALVAIVLLFVSYFSWKKLSA
ncbi:MAG: DoxX family protein [Bacteroidota bacterium]